MNARTKLGWVDIPQQSLRRGLACDEGGVRVLLLMGDEREPARPSSAASREAPADLLLAEKPR